MSIYATLWELQFPLHGQSHTDCEWETVIAQGVPEHVGEEGSTEHLLFLPPRGESIAGGLWVVVFVRKLQSKGTDRFAQEYPHPLLMVTGKEYEALSFGELHQTLADALRGTRPRLVAELQQPDGSVKLIFEGGQSQLVRNPREA